MSYVFSCRICGSRLSSVNFNDPESVDELSQSVVNLNHFQCSCDADYQFGLFDVSNKVPIKPIFDWED